MSRVFQLEEQKRGCERSILDLKKRLLRAKLEVVHEIRTTISV
jgi:hypothetical protein